MPSREKKSDSSYEDPVEPPMRKREEDKRAMQSTVDAINQSLTSYARTLKWTRSPRK